jgi:hypothetical protein
MKGLDTAITLSWNRLPGYAEGTVGFILEVGGDSSLTPGPSTRTVATIDTSVVLHSLDFLTAHWWRVKSRFESGSESPYSPSWVFSTGLPMPGSVALLHPESDVVVNRDTLVFNWRRVGPLVTRYWLEYSIDSAFTVKGVVSMLTDTTATIAGLVKSMSYHWRVRAGNASGWGAFSPPRVFLRSALAVDDKSIPLPETWVLEQNYPNPFNPSTTIRYGAPAAAHVSLTLFNTLGQQVAVLQDGDREAGYHEVQFDAHGLPSGVYFYRILVRPSDSVLGRDSRGGAGSFVETMKCLLLR